MVLHLSLRFCVIHSGRYAVNVAFNLTNKSIYKFFPFPWTVSTIHVLVGAIYCGIAYLIGAKKASFGRVRIHDVLKGGLV